MSTNTKTVLVYLSFFCLTPALQAQQDRVTSPGDATHAVVPAGKVPAPDNSNGQALSGHVPPWATANNLAGAVPPDRMMGPMTMVLSRPPEREQAFEKLLADQQNPASPDYHHWLTPAEVGERFGLLPQDVEKITGWLESEGFKVNWVSPSRIFIGFSGTAAEVNRAFRTELCYYTVNGEQRLSVSSEPVVPAALAPSIKAIRGLHTDAERPAHHAAAGRSNSPAVAGGGGYNYMAPADFATIYDVPAAWTGAGVTIGIVGRSRTDFADFDEFRLLTGSTFANPTEVIPTAFGGVDPGPALTSPPSAGVDIGNQTEATLDVTRAGSVAPGANLLLVVATDASGGIGADAQYLVETSPVPAQVMTFSFQSCELGNQSGVSFWDSLFQQAASEGISVFVSSGDSGASDCDTSFKPPPESPAANSPNAICSSSHATCVGGTEFNDSADPSLYWNSNNGTGLGSAMSYIPEGAWNEPLNGSGDTQVAASTGGVSAFIPTPSWQTGTGVPSPGTGRYTPDISFSASNHDGYFGCFAAADGESCAVGADGSYGFGIFSGTSAAAPDMAGVAALLDQKAGGAQGNLNQALYTMAASVPAAFHDVTVATSGVTDCDVNTPSMCNNSIAGPTGLSGGQPGYLVTTGYDLVTGLGSLDVGTFLNNYGNTLTATTTTVAASPQTIQSSGSTMLTATVSPASGSGTPTGSVVFTLGGITLGTAALSGANASLTVNGSQLTAGADTIVATYGGDSNFSGSSGSVVVTVNVAGVTFTANPNPIVVTSGPLVGSTTLTWNAPGYSQLTICIGSPTGNQLTGTVGSSGSISTGDYVTNGMQFFLVDLTSHSSIASVTVQVTGPTPPPAGVTFTANPNPIVVSSGPLVGSTTLTWNAPGYSQLAICIGSPTGNQLTGTVGSSGSVATGNWVTNGMQFFLVNLTSHSSIASVTVQVTGPTPPPSGVTFTANPNPIVVTSGPLVGTTTLIWNAPGYSQLAIFIGSPTGNQLTGTVGSSGSVLTGNYVTDGMQFFLVDLTSHSSIASVTVHVVAFYATPNPIVSATNTGETTLTWNAPSYSQLAIFIGSPTGNQLTGTVGSSGSVSTGNWVTNGMQFFLVDLISHSSIASVTVQVTGSTPPPFGVDNSMMTESVNTSNVCQTPTATTSFLESDPAAYVWFAIHGGNTGDVAKAQWYGPGGTLYTTLTWTPLTSGGSLCFWGSMSISGFPPATMPGNWSVVVSWNGTQVITLPFTIRGSHAVVVPSVSPDPVYEQGGSWSCKVTLTEAAGVATTFTSFTFAGIDYSSYIPSLFLTSSIPAFGTISASLPVTVYNPPQNILLTFGGQDPGTGTQWNTQITVPFLGPQSDALPDGALLPVPAGARAVAPGNEPEENAIDEPARGAGGFTMGVPRP